jgi:hypothetical protein
MQSSLSGSTKCIRPRVAKMICSWCRHPIGETVFCECGECGDCCGGYVLGPCECDLKELRQRRAEAWSAMHDPVDVPDYSSVHREWRTLTKALVRHRAVRLRQQTAS